MSWQVGMLCFGRGGGALLGLLGTLACASHPPAAAPPSPQVALAAQPSECRAAGERARALLDAGRLWSARRALLGCEAEAAALLAQVGESLGEPRRGQAAQPVSGTDLEAVERQLGSGDCGGALAAAESRYQSTVPSVEAAVLAGLSSACLQREADARRWYARAHFEAELSSAASGWKVPEVPSSVSWRGPSLISLRTKAGAAALSDASGKGQWAWRHLPSPPPAAPWVSGNVQVALEGDTLSGKDGAGNVVWRRALAPLSDVSPAFAEGQALLLERVRDTFQIRYEQLELSTGRVLRSGRVEGLEPRAVVSAPFAGWFSFETPEPKGRDIIVVVVDGQGKARRHSVDASCRPLAAWSASELVSDCGDPSSLFAVDVRTLQRRKLVDKPPGQFQHARALSERLVGFSGTAGVFLLRGTGSTGAVEPAPELAGVEWESVSWSPDRSRLAALGKVAEREQLVIYSRTQRSVQASFSGYRDHSPPLQAGFALSRDRLKLGLGTCPELAVFDLRTGAHVATPLAQCSPWLEPRGADGFGIVDRAPKSPRAESPDGKYVVYQTRSEQNGTVRRALVLAAVTAGTPPGLQELWQTPIHRDAPALFSRASRTLYFLRKGAPGSNAPDTWQELDVPSLHVKPAARAAALEGAVELSEDGATALRAGSLVGADGKRRELAHAPWSDVEAARRDGLGFALGDRLVVGRRDREAWLWRARDGSFVGRIQPLAGGGALFTGARPRDQRSGPETAPLQVFGPQAAQGVVCVLGERQHAWEVCEDRYGDDELLARALSSASK